MLEKNETKYTFMCPEHGCFAGYLKEIEYYRKEVEISSIRKFSEDTWIVEGNVVAYCPYCHEISNAILNSLKIECEGFSCPTCNKKDNLNFNIISISKTSTEDATYEFDAEIVCKKCHSQISIKKILKDILSIKKLKVSPTEVDIEK